MMLIITPAGRRYPPSFSRTKYFSQLRHIIIIKMMEHGQNNLYFLIVLPVISKICHNFLFGSEFLPLAKNPDFRVPRGQNRQSLLGKSPRHFETLFYGLLFRPKSGFFICILSLPKRTSKFRTGVGTICPGSYHPKNGFSILLI